MRNRFAKAGQDQAGEGGSAIRGERHGHYSIDLEGNNDAGVQGQCILLGLRSGLQTELSETHLAESKLLKIRKLRKKLRKIDGSITEGSALDRVHEFISTVNERIQNIEDQLEDLGGAVDLRDAFGKDPKLGMGILIDRMARLEHKFHIMATDMYTIRQLINPCSYAPQG